MTTDFALRVTHFRRSRLVVVVSMAKRTKRTKDQHVTSFKQLCLPSEYLYMSAVAESVAKRAPHGMSQGSQAANMACPPPDDLLSAASWHRFGSDVGLSCGGASEVRWYASSGEYKRQLRQKMVQEGYAQISDWADSAWLDSMSANFGKAIDRLDAAGLPAVYLLAFDEVWAVTNSLKGVLEPIFGHGLTFDFYVFNIKPGGSGWGMHRERSGADAKKSFDRDSGLPAYNTVWLALTDASPATSCMYALPASADPEYSCAPDERGATDDVDISTLLTERLPYVRALPVPRTSALVWSHRLIHWGSAHGGAPHARKTLAFALADPAFEPPLLRAVDAAAPIGPLPPLDARIAIISHLLVRFNNEASHPAPLWPATLLQALTLLLACAEHLSDASLEWYSQGSNRASPVAQGSVLQMSLTRLLAQHGPRPVDDVARRTVATVEGLAKYIVHTRKLTACDELAALAGGGAAAAAGAALAKQAPAPPPPPAVVLEQPAAPTPAAGGFVYDEVD